MWRVIRRKKKKTTPNICFFVDFSKNAVYLLIENLGSNSTQNNGLKLHKPQFIRLYAVIPIPCCIGETKFPCVNFTLLLTLGSSWRHKANGGDGIPVGLFKILKDDAVKVLYSIGQQIWKTQQWPQDWKRSVSFQSQRKAMQKNAQTTAQLHSTKTLAK